MCTFRSCIFYGIFALFGYYVRVCQVLNNTTYMSNKVKGNVISVCGKVVFFVDHQYKNK